MATIPYVIQYILGAYLFYPLQFVSINPITPVCPPPHFSLPFSNHKFVFHISEPLYVLYMYSFACYFRFCLQVISHSIYLCLISFTKHDAL